MKQDPEKLKHDRLIHQVQEIAKRDVRTAIDEARNRSLVGARTDVKILANGNARQATVLAWAYAIEVESAFDRAENAVDRAENAV